MIKRFIQIAEHLLIFQNYNSLLAIMGGLAHYSISRLTKAWRLCNLKIFKKLKRITSPKRNFSKIRRLYNGANFPCIPPLVIMLRDLLYIQDGNISFKNDFINLEKMVLYAKIVGRIYNNRDSPYSFVKVQFIQNYIQNFEVLSEEELERKSKECE